MYEYVSNKDKEFLSKMRTVCADLVNRLVVLINSEKTLRVEAHLVGSGARNLETQNENEPIDLDYNLVILDTNRVSINNCKAIKEYVRRSFNIVLGDIGWGDCKDSKSALTTEKRHFTIGNKTEFSIDLAIVCESDGLWYRLIHKKTGYTNIDEYYWNEAPNSKGLRKKAQWIKDNRLWGNLRKIYLEKKNMYLRRGDNNHPSFNCYIETVNEVCQKWGYK